ncbi:MAG TPA: acyltransferase [Acidimicrobiia bacterium]|jgi:peptidoglycan/LPS O-acetylase OafA/YrhL|nr:acyltransferase [Acidimicrobiia bacterium]
MSRPGRHVPELDGLRALAILSVFVFHARGTDTTANTAQETFYRITETGWTGVDLFFVLSGFLITGILLDSRDGRHYFKSFFARRVLRILPLYYAVLTVVSVGVVSHAMAGSSAAVPYYWVYLQNWLQIHPDDYRIRMLNHFWSLAIEEQFYLVWPLLIWALPRRAIAPMCGAAVAIAAALRIVLMETGTFETHTLHFLTFTRIDTLALGGLVAVVVRSPDGVALLKRLMVPVATAAVAGIVAVAVLTGHFRAEDPEMVWWGYVSIEALFACAIVACLAASEDGAWRRFLRRPKLMWVGKVSYGAYVYHWIVIVLLGKVWPFKTRLGFWPNQIAWWIATLSITLVVAAASYRLYESRFLALKDRFKPDAA